MTNSNIIQLHSERIYFDHCATTKIYDEAQYILLKYSGNNFGNPSSLYKTARSLRKDLDNARETLALAFGCLDIDIVFTSGGTEADNLAIYGCSGMLFNAFPKESQRKLSPVLVSAIEHEAVLNPAKALLAGEIRVGCDGLLDLDHLKSLLDDYQASQEELKLVSVMLVNNETGVIQPLEEVASMVKRYYPNALIHSDCVQAFGALDIREVTKDIDLMSFSAHKFGGPMGTGALVMRSRARKNFTSLIRGGQQERGYRAGTENLPAIMAMAEAAKICVARREKETARLKRLAEKLNCGIKKISREISLVASETKKIDHIMLFHIPGVYGEEICYLLDKENIEVSTGSACAAGAREPSHVLLAMGWTRREARQVIRVSLGRTNTEEEIDRFLFSFQKVLESFPQFSF